MFEETGCNVELAGILQIANKVSPSDTWISVIFATKLIEENIAFDKKEILDVKWFTYEELLNMKNELRAYDWIIDSIKALRENKILDINRVIVIK